MGAGAVGSLTLMLRAGTHTPRLLLVIFVFWILAPFAALAWAQSASKRWSISARSMLDSVTIVLALASLALYGGLIPAPAGSAHAFIFVAGPVASLVVVAIVVAIGTWMSRGRPQPGAR